jgi:GT2 family glycosyltransferase
VIVAFDGSTPSADVPAQLDGVGARSVVLDARGGPGAARNRGAAEARGAFLAFTEDDCVPEPDWLERVAARLTRDPRIDVIVGATLSPGGRPTRRPDGVHPHYLPTNLFVRRELFQRVGGYCVEFFDAARGIYFREDSDFGFTLEEAGAQVAIEPSARVIHPVEHPGYLDPLRWARRYEMDALLQARHPRLFRERIEIHRLGPFTVRRVFLRACVAYTLALFAAGVAVMAGESGLAALFLGFTALSFAVVWSKWRFDVARLPVIAVTPFALIGAYLRGRGRRRG